MTGNDVRRVKAAFSSGCKSHPAIFAPASINWISHGEVADRAGKARKRGTMMSWRNILSESSWCKSSPVKAVAALNEEVGFKFTSFMADIAKRFIPRFATSTQGCFIPGGDKVTV